MSDEEIGWWLNQIRLGTELTLQERVHFCKPLRKFVHIFTFNYKDLYKISLKTYKIELVQNAKIVRQKIHHRNMKYTKVMKVELEKLLEIGFIILVENTE